MKIVLVRSLHAALVVLACIPWLIATTLLAVAVLLVIWADKVWPEADWGNCWSFLGPKWAKYGGYIGIRAASDIKFLKIFIIPHAIWIRHLGTDSSVIQAAPKSRSQSKWLPWRVFYFPFVTLSKERDRPSTDWKEEY